MISKKFHATCAAYLESLAGLRQQVDTVCRHMGLKDQTIYDIKLSIDEASTNIIQYGYEGMDPGSIILEMIFESDKVIVHLTDFGHPFEPKQAPKPDLSAPLEEREPGGFGLFFIYSVMDEVDYHTDEDGNTLTLIKRLS
jgi:serine/threonine-protein kinase RsbW